MRDRNQANELYAKYLPQIFNRCRRFLRSDDEAQEAAGTVFRDLLDRYESLREPGHAERWIDRTTAGMRLAERKRVQVWILGRAGVRRETGAVA